jgi:hypothetical protein
MRKCYVITESGVEIYNSMSALKKDAKIESHEMTKVGADLVVNMTDQSFEIAKDIKLLEAVASKKVFSKDKFDTTNWLILCSILITYLMNN